MAGSSTKKSGRHLRLSPSILRKPAALDRLIVPEAGSRCIFISFELPRFQLPPFSANGRSLPVRTHSPAYIINTISIRVTRKWLGFFEVLHHPVLVRSDLPSAARPGPTPTTVAFWYHKTQWRQQ